MTVKEVDSRICAIAAQRVCNRRGKYTEEVGGRGCVCVGGFFEEAPFRFNFEDCTNAAVLGLFNHGPARGVMLSD